MKYSDSVAFDDDNSNFVIIQSCLRDERHNELIQNSKNITLLDNHLTFNLGDSFESFEALKLRLDAHSEHSHVHYWMRDTRTVAGARMKTTRRIELQLKYYNVRYACVYGGHKHFSKSKGKRHTSTMKMDCPSHIALRANCTGERLDVVSVCNHHNHTIGPDVSQQLRQARRLSSQLKEEVLDLLRMGVVKHRILDYVHNRSGKKLRYKDIINMAATVKGSPRPAAPRRKHLFASLKKVELEHRKLSAQIKDEDEQSPETKRWRRRLPKKTGASNNRPPKIGPKEEPSPVEILHEADGAIDGSIHDDVYREVEVHYEEENGDSIANSEIMEYLYQTDETVLTIINKNEQMIGIAPDDTDHPNSVQDESNDRVFQTFNEEGTVIFETDDNQLGNPVMLLNGDEEITLEFNNTRCVSEEEMVTLENGDHTVHSPYDQPVLAIFNEKELTILGRDGSEQCINHVSIQDPQMEESFEEASSQNNQIISPKAMHILTDDEVVLEEEWISGDAEIVNVQTEQEEQSAEYEIDRCSNCDKIKFDLNAEVNNLKVEKGKLTDETETLRRERDGLLQEIIGLKEKKDVKINPPTPFGCKQFKLRNKLYLVKI